MSTSTSVQLPSLRKRHSRTLAEEAVDALNTLIQNGHFEPGDKLPSESEIMNQLGVSRTVVREAISRLQASGVVETRHGIGTFVSAIADDPLALTITSVNTARDALALLDVRIALEVESAALAARHRNAVQLAAITAALERLTALETASEVSTQASIEADYAFHQSIAMATGNNYFPQYLAHLGKESIPRSRLMIEEHSHKRYLSKLNQEHRLIYLAIQAKDSSGASEAMRNHLTKSQRRLKRALDEQQA